MARLAASSKIQDGYTAALRYDGSDGPKQSGGDVHDRNVGCLILDRIDR